MESIIDRPLLRRSLRIRNRDERRRREELERKELEERKALLRIPKRLTKQKTTIRVSSSSKTTTITSSPSSSSSSKNIHHINCDHNHIHKPKRKKIFQYSFSQLNTSPTHLTNIPLDMLLYLLEFLGE
ncbi:hypothetical protein Glove_241g62 [Diversispora epigaea]|uniref:Uncharacterized protein n=1 Tax=Diversispora epigaea TaxID=1348612 RepID=A0A397ICT2_9GLOM|nr:hypothetical protein Glove_241g62 [Diversispora epigaea]